MQVCKHIMGPGSWESFRDPSARHEVQLSICFGGICLLSMEDYAPSVFLRNWTLVVLYLCSKFHIFSKPILEEYVC
jgi:hypothetical protein